LLAVEMAVGLQAQGQQGIVYALAALFLVVNLVFVFRSFYGMRIVAKKENA
jgi:K(+)-stimulated pyrophosphate-energized sodium pump